jgi:hypothetical protein
MANHSAPYCKWHVRRLKTRVASKPFATDADVRQAATPCLQTLITGYFQVAIQALVSEWDECFTVSGDCVNVISGASAISILCFHQSKKKNSQHKSGCTLFFGTYSLWNLSFSRRWLFSWDTRCCYQSGKNPLSAFASTNSRISTRTNKI